jgi:hypothetical protein
MADFDSNSQALDILTTLAHALARGDVSGGNNIIIQMPDIIKGEDDVAGTVLVLRGGTSSGGNNPGAIVLVEGGDGDGTGAGGNVLLRPGESLGSGARGFVRMTNNGGTDDEAIAEIESEGANAGVFHFFTGNRNPLGSVTALAVGDLYIRTDNGTLWQAQATGTGGWVQIGLGTGTGTVKTFDTRASPTSTANLVSGGGTVDLDITSLFTIGHIMHLEVVRTLGTGGSDVDIEIYTEDTYSNRVYNASGADITSVAYVDRTGIFYEDLDATDELHIRITNNSGADFTADVKVVAQGE